MRHCRFWLNKKVGMETWSAFLGGLSNEIQFEQNFQDIFYKTKNLNRIGGYLLAGNYTPEITSQIISQIISVSCFTCEVSGSPPSHQSLSLGTKTSIVCFTCDLANIYALLNCVSND